jgi:hypothetical protein
MPTMNGRDDMRHGSSVAPARLAASLAVVAALGGTAHAGADVGVIVTGDGAIQPQLAAQLESWLGQHGHTLVPSPLPPDAVTALVDCFATEDQGCARAVIEKRAKPSTIVYTRIDAKSNATSGARDIVLTAYLFEKGHDTLAERKACERCTDQALRTTADDLLNKLVGAGAPPGQVKLTSRPPSAKITIDGKPTGFTPLDWDLPVGRHTIAVSKPGYTTSTREVVVESNKTQPVAFELTRPTATRPDDGDRPAWPMVAVITGGALVVGGAVVALIPSKSGQQDPARVLDTRKTGLAIAVSGAAIGAVGAYFRWFRSDDARSAPVAAITSDSALVGWAGRF